MDPETLLKSPGLKATVNTYCVRLKEISPILTLALMIRVFLISSQTNSIRDWLLLCFLLQITPTRHTEATVIFH